MNQLLELSKWKHSDIETNTERSVRLAASHLGDYSHREGMTREDIETILSYFLTDVLHLSDKLGINFDSCLRMALNSHKI